MQVLIESYRPDKIIEMLESDKKKIDDLLGEDKGVFTFRRDLDCINKIYLNYSEAGLNVIKKKVLFEGFKFKIRQIDHSAKVRKM